ncbi:DMT family transporter [Tepidimicrobium xylanilyticum]|uniref:Uncharacterized membrane protein n=1 Tax=Tepidimicrobium xylanilyticum TaxID=1123352 RepID=A0A1H2RDA3_9FIRM|nr:DMT family transporter [Tepidimicrobium xylanilyticum]GMG95457.1 hypothetical protein EN5CB1_02830 [Tepidimicrobium xylanilyticum]SDW17285.1 Uncharacterized membrane protein [Tepidimicrobium xylanilyticum]
MKDKKYPSIGRGEAWALLAAFSYALTNVVLKWALADAPPLFGAAIKTMPMWLISIIVFLGKEYLKKLNPRSEDFIGMDSILILALLGFIVYVLGNWAFFEALKVGAVILTTPIMGTQAMWATLISYIFLKEKMNFPMILGMLISFLGVILLTIGNLGGNIMLEGWQKAVPLTLLAALCYSSSGVIKRYLFTKKSLDRWTVSFLEVTTGEILLHIIFLIQGNNYYSIIPCITISKFIFAGLFGALAIISITTATSLTQVASATTINSTQTAIAPILAMILLGEKVNLEVGLGIILIMAGVMIVQLKKPVTD